MEDWLHFAESYAPFVLRDVLHPEVEAAWEHLRQAVMHYLRLEENTLQPGVRRVAEEHLREYAVAVETFLPVHLCTFNLHLIVCHSHEQETQTGTIFESSEFWIERGVGECKEVVKYRLTSAPDKVVVGHHLLKRRLIELAREPEMKDLPEKFFPKRGQHGKQDESAPEEDSLIGRGESFVLNFGPDVGTSDGHAIYRCLCQYAIQFPLAEIDAFRFQVAWIGGEVVQSLA